MEKEVEFKDYKVDGGESSPFGLHSTIKFLVYSFSQGSPARTSVYLVSLHFL